MEEEESYIRYLKTRRARLVQDSNVDVDPELSNAQETSAIKANLFCSDQSNSPDRHMLILDLDMPIEVLKSSSGNNHVIIPTSLTFESMMEILNVLAKHNILQKKWVKCAKQNGYAALRMPGIKKSRSEDNFGLDENGNIETNAQYYDAVEEAVARQNNYTTEEEIW